MTEPDGGSLDVASSWAGPDPSNRARLAECRAAVKTAVAARDGAVRGARIELDQTTSAFDALRSGVEADRARLTKLLAGLNDGQGAKLHQSLGVTVYQLMIKTPTGSSTLLEGCEAHADTEVHHSGYATQGPRPQRRTVTRAVVGGALLGPVGVAGSLMVPKKGAAPKTEYHEVSTTSTVVTIETPRLSAAVTCDGDPTPAHKLVTAVRAAAAAAPGIEAARPGLIAAATQDLASVEERATALHMSGEAIAVQRATAELQRVEADVALQQPIDQARGRLAAANAESSFMDRYFRQVALAVLVAVVIIVVVLLSVLS